MHSSGAAAVDGIWNINHQVITHFVVIIKHIVNINSSSITLTPSAHIFTVMIRGIYSVAKPRTDEQIKQQMRA